MRKWLFLVLLGGFLAANSGCATSNGPAGRNSSGPIERGDIEDSGQTFVDAYDVVRFLRPSWLHKRGNATFRGASRSEIYDYIVVYEDRARLGDLESLRTISAHRISKIEFLKMTETKRLSPFAHPHGAIVVYTSAR